MTVRVLLADDERLVRAGFRVLLERAPDIEVVAEAADGDEAIALTRAHRPDVALMDIRMPGTDGLTAARRIMSDGRLPGVRVVVLTTFELDEYVYAALQAGASGFLLKDVEPDELRRAVRVVAAGDALLAPAVTRRLIAAFASGPAVPGTETLTAREREVVALVAAGLSDVEVGLRLSISPATAKTHANRAMAKLGARDRAQLVVFAYRSGLAGIPRPR
ncbi:response regulator transcription factor [Micromonospora sp. DR5-3]|uniref:response regulator transcription factor n=1 Tax=unclassified Micromonospora TaxID=2617518 RepID=UPI0011D67F45|nr:MULTISPECIES: response regulator transcription factor [unclassified Micromonospora]MCW3820447.1 response regulator transcription factor [Micromonospora sp. DR5-3]TYC20404.1 response regulator transcription factor [Micromonospora sp. MP36]